MIHVERAEREKVLVAIDGSCEKAGMILDGGTFSLLYSGTKSGIF